MIDPAIASATLRGPHRASSCTTSPHNVASRDRAAAQGSADHVDERLQARIDVDAVLDRVEDRDGVVQLQRRDRSRRVRVTRPQLGDELPTARFGVGELCELRA